MNSTESKDPLGLQGQCVADKYLVERIVGDGGFGLVYRATHKILREPVAIKFFFALSSAPEHLREALLEGFVREGKLMSQLSTYSSSIVQARDMGSLTLPDGAWIPYLVLEWLEGRSLAAVLDSEIMMGRPPRSLVDAVRVMEGSAQALALAHSLGVAHLDIKPDNFFVCGPVLEPGVPVKVLDFGVSKVFDASRIRTSDTKSEPLAMLTPDYAAPEMFDPEYGELGSQSDVFGFALLIMELMRGGIPVMSDGDAALVGDVTQIRQRCLDPDKRPTPRNIGLQVEDEIEAVFAKALTLHSSDRYESMEVFWGELRRALGLVTTTHDVVEAELSAIRSMTRAPTAAAQSTQMPGPQTEIRSHRGYVAVGLGSLAVAGLVGAVMLNASSPVSTEKTTQPAAPVASIAATQAQPQCPEGMIYVPGGRFFMGSDSDARALAAARPAHAMTLEPYCLDKTEVTVAAYRACSSQGLCKRAFRKSQWKGSSAQQRKAYSVLCNENFRDRPTHPVNCVTWIQARDYCKQHGYRLPLEAEWEFAARGSDGRVFPWGDHPPDAAHANACGAECTRWRELRGLKGKAPLYARDDGYAGTAPVGSFAPGAGQWGHVDLVGNLFEWTASEYLPYPLAQPAKLGFSAAKAIKHVIRGGAFNSFNANFADPALRFGMLDGTHSHGVGFRCAADPTLGGAGGE